MLFLLFLLGLSILDGEIVFGLVNWFGGGR